MIFLILTNIFFVLISIQLSYSFKSNLVHSNSKLSKSSQIQYGSKAQSSKHNSKLFANSENEDALSRRRKRSSKSRKENAKIDKEITSTVKEKEIPQLNPSNILDDASVDSVEKLFGLGDDQLRELLEQELPVPREDLVSRKESKTTDKDKVFNLPELAEYVKENDKDKKIQRLDGLTDTERETLEDSNRRVSRSDQDEYLRVLQLNPFADADDTLFLEEYDIIPYIFGNGKLLNIPVSFLQNGHGLLFLITALGAFIYSPGNPLTDFPPEIREFLKTGLAIVYGINFVLSIIAFNVAKEKNLPTIFWTIKTFLLGGIAYYELSQAKDPKFIQKQSMISQKKSKRRI